jgi:hypothetical protein
MLALTLLAVNVVLLEVLTSATQAAMPITANS